MPRPFLVNTKRNPAALVRYGRVRPEPREMVMKKKSLAMLVAALSIGVSSMGLMSATAKDAAIIKKKGAAQTDQSGGSAQQQPHASGAQVAQPEAGTVT